MDAVLVVVKLFLCGVFLVTLTGVAQVLGVKKNID